MGSEGIDAELLAESRCGSRCAGQRAMETLEAEQGRPSTWRSGRERRCWGWGASASNRRSGYGLPSLRSGKPEWEQMLDSLGRIYLRGTDIDWDGYDRQYLRRRVSLPTYPFERRHYWIETDSPSVAGTDPGLEWSSIYESVSRQADQGGLNLDIASYPERWATLDVLAAEYISRAFHSLGLYQRAGERHSAETLIASRSIRPIYRMLMQRWLQHLAANNLLSAQGEWYTAA